MITCYFCKGQVEEKQIDYMAKHDLEYVLIKHLKAQVCAQCGEVYLDPAASRQIDEAIANRAKAQDYLEVPIVHCG